MATAHGIRAVRAFVELFADDSQLVRGLKAAERRLKAFGAGVRSIGTQLLGVGAGIATPLVAATDVFVDLGDQLAKMSARTGISVECCRNWGYAAEQSAVDLSGLEGGVCKMQRFVFEAAKVRRPLRGRCQASASLSRIWPNCPPDQQFERIADRQAEIDDPVTRAALAVEVFGKTGTSLLPLMQDGAKGIAALRQQARDLGLVISTEGATAAETFGHRLSDLWKLVKSGVFVVGTALAPLLQDLAISATRIAKGIADWVRQNRALIVTEFKVAVGIAVAGAALAAIGALISVVATAFGLAASVITRVGTAVGVIVASVSALLSPLGLVVAGIVGLGVYLIYESGAGAAALDWLGRKISTRPSGSSAMRSR